VDGVLISRWDNAPCHNELFNAPHQKHIQESVESSEEVTVLKVLRTISKAINIWKNHLLHAVPVCF